MKQLKFFFQVKFHLTIKFPSGIQKNLILPKVYLILEEFEDIRHNCICYLYGLFLQHRKVLLVERHKIKVSICDGVRHTSLGYSVGAYHLAK